MKPNASSTSAMVATFEKPDKVSPRRRLEEIAVKAAEPKAFETAVAKIVRAVRSDADLLWELCQAHADRAARDLLRSMARNAASSAVGERKIGAPRSGCAAAPQKVKAPVRGVAAALGAEAAMRRTMLDEMTKCGKPVRACTKEELEKLIHEEKDRAFSYKVRIYNECLNDLLESSQAIAD